MKKHRCSANFEGRIKRSVTYLAERGRSNQRNNNSATIVIELRRLDNHYERNAVLVIAGVAVDIKLRHQSDEYSSLIEPDFALKSFHNFTVDSTALCFARRSSRAVA